MDLKLVYGFIPNEGSLEKMIEKRAMELAKNVVTKTSHNMALEDQQNSEERLQQAIRGRALIIKWEMPKYLWE